MAETGYPVVIDATHAVMKPNSMGGCSGGESRFAQIIARAALSSGVVAGVFTETHPEPLTSGSDKYNMIPLMYMPKILEHLKRIDTIAKENRATLTDWKQEGRHIDELLRSLT